MYRVKIWFKLNSACLYALARTAEIIKNGSYLNNNFLTFLVER